MPSIKITFKDGSSYIYDDVPEEVTQEEVYARAIQDFPKKSITVMDKLGKPSSVGDALLSGVKGSAAFMGDLAIGLPKMAAGTALAVGGKLTNPDISFQKHLDNANAAMEDTFPSLSKSMGVENDLSYKAPMAPFTAYGEGVQKAADLLSFGNEDVEGALNVIGNFAPIPFAGKAAKGVQNAHQKVYDSLADIKLNRKTKTPTPEVDVGAELRAAAAAKQAAPKEPRRATQAEIDAQAALNRLSQYEEANPSKQSAAPYVDPRQDMLPFTNNIEDGYQGVVPKQGDLFKDNGTGVFDYDATSTWKPNAFDNMVGSLTKESPVLPTKAETPTPGTVGGWGKQDLEGLLNQGEQGRQAAMFQRLAAERQAELAQKQEHQRLAELQGMRVDSEGGIWNKDNVDVQGHIDALNLQRDKQAAADMLIRERQAALEQQVARQHSLDFNAAERARQEQGAIPPRHSGLYLENNPTDFTANVLPDSPQARARAEELAAQERYAEAQRQRDAYEAEQQRLMQERVQAGQLLRNEGGLPPNAAQNLDQSSITALRNKLENEHAAGSLEEALASARQLAELNSRGQQMSIVEDYGNNNPMDHMPHMRMDTRTDLLGNPIGDGIPFRADLSMEAQHLQDPLQRNLWGDELPIQTGDGGIPLTQAIDNMPPGSARTRGIQSLQHEMKAPDDLQMASDTANSFANGDASLLPEQSDPVAAKALSEANAKRDADATQSIGRMIRSSRGLGGKGGLTRGAATPDFLTMGLARMIEKSFRKVERSVKDLTREQRLGQAVLSSVNKDVAEHVPPGPALQDWIEAALQDKNNGAVAHAWQSGLIGAAQKQESVGLQGAGRWLNWGQKAGDWYIRKNVLPLERSLAKLGKKDLMAINDVLRYEEETGSALTGTDIANMSSVTADAINLRQSFRKIQNDMATRVNAVLEAAGQKPMTISEHYYAASWKGDWDLPVYDKNGEKVFHLRANSKKEIAAQVKALREKFPELDLDDKGFAGSYIKQRGADGRMETVRSGQTNAQFMANRSGGSARYDVLTHYTQMLNMLGDSSLVPAIKEAMGEWAKEQGVKYHGQNVHMETKHGVRGFRGDRPDFNKSQNAKDGLKAQIDYMKQTYSWLTMQEALKNVNDFMAHPELQKTQPENMALIKAYVNEELGTGVNYVRDLEAGFAEWMGRSRADLYDATYMVKSAFYLQQLGFNMGQTLGSLGSFFLSAPAEIASLSSQGYKGGTLSAWGLGVAEGLTAFSQHGSNWLADRFGTKAPNVPMSAFGKSATKYMEDNGIINKTMFDEESDIGVNPVLQTAAKTAGATITLPEHMTRSVMFMVAARKIKSSAPGKYMTDMEIFQKAEESTNLTLTGFNRADRPLIVNRMGTVGLSTYMYKSFLVSLANNMISMTQRREGKALMALVLAHQLMGGVGNAPGVPEVDAAWQKFRDWQAEKNPAFYTEHLRDLMPHGISGEIMKRGWYDWAKHGVPSAMLGAGIASKFSPQMLDIDRPSSNFAGAAGHALDMVTDVPELTSQEGALGYAHNYLAPPMLAGAMENHLDAFGRDVPTGRAIGNPYASRGTDTKTSYVRDTKDQAMRYAGLRSLKETETRRANNMEEREYTRQNAAGKALEQKIARARISGNMQNVSKEISAYYMLYGEKAQAKLEALLANPQDFVEASYRRALAVKEDDLIGLQSVARRSKFDR
jgi:hypothetical protein